jgi:2-iminoacetate synthase
MAQRPLPPAACNSHGEQPCPGCGTHTADWVRTRIRHDQITRYLEGEQDFIDDAAIHRALERHQAPDPGQVRAVLEKAKAICTLTLDEAALLLHVRDDRLQSEMEQAAWDVKHKVYDNRIVTFAPLYLSTRCVNDCLYCGFRSGNPQMQRGVLTPEEIRAQIEVLAGTIGHKRLIASYGEHPSCDAAYIAESLRTIYSVQAGPRPGRGQIRRVNVNAAPMSIEDLRDLHGIGIGTYQVFMETYHHDTYAQVHPSGTLKHDYRWRLYATHRAMEAGVDDVGLGALFGLYDWRFEVLGLLAHARELESRFGIGPHTISFPRLEPAQNSRLASQQRYPVSDEEFRRLITVLRLAVPYTGMILTAREPAPLRDALIPLGITQMDASARIGLKAYTDPGQTQAADRQQFTLNDTRSLDECIRMLAERGMITSFCTAGYRCGRTGQCIMSLLRSGKEGHFCKINAILTYKEWLDDFGSAATREIGERLLQTEIAQVAQRLPELYPTLRQAYDRICGGERDIWF